MLMTQDKEEYVYIRSGGNHYHFNKDCIMLNGDQFEKYKYREVEFSKLPKHYYPCPGCSEPKRRKQVSDFQI